MKMAAFNQGQTPTIVCINKATTPLGCDLGAMVAALQIFVDKYFAPVWGTAAHLTVANDFVKGCWAIVFIDNADVDGALGYHDLTPDGLPLSKIFVQTTVEDGGKVSVTACHELAEMLVDPAINLCALDQHGSMYAYETADAVEEEEFLINGIAMSDFVYPSYFEGFRKPGSVKFDYLGKIKKPFQILKGGYMPVFRNGQWTQIFGSKAKEKSFKAEDRRGHRTSLRAQKKLSRSK